MEDSNHDYKAIGAHVFMGGFARGIAESLDVQAHYEIFDLGEKTVEHNLGIPFYRGDSEHDWRELVMDQHRDVDVVYGNPRCTGFSALGHGCTEDAHGAFSKPTVDIRQLALLASWVKPKIWAFESVQQAGTTGRPLITWLHQTYGDDYVLHELYHNAAQFGNAQHRKRVIFMWVRKDLQAPVAEITEECVWRGPHRTIEEMLHKGDDETALWNLEPTVLKSFKDMTDIAHVEAASPWFDTVTGGFQACAYNHHYVKVTDTYLRAAIETAIEGTSLNGVPPKLLDKNWPELAEKSRMGISFSWHAPRKLHRQRASPVVYSQSDKFIHPQYPRPCTVRELCRLMGLPDDWAVIGPDPVAQLGKGVCTDVGRWWGKLAKATLDGEVKPDPMVGDHHVWRLDSPEFGLVPKKARIQVEYEGEGD